MNTYGKLLMITMLAGFALPVSAQVRITEIMYDRDGTDSGYEWVEVVNEGSGAIEFVTWSFVENEVDHRINAVSETTSIAPGARAVLADDPSAFIEDFPTYLGVLFDSSFSLSNDGEQLMLKDASGAVVGTVAYDPEWGAEGNGATLQEQDDGDWIAGLPTPGEENMTEAYEEPEEDTGEDMEEESDDIDFDTPESRWPFDTEVFISAGENRRVFEDEPVEFQAEARQRNGGEVRDTEFSWVFGDGDMEDGERVEHTFDFPGVYSVVLVAEVDGRHYMDRVKIEVVEPALEITEVTENSVTIENKMSYEMEVGGWSLVSEYEREREVSQFPDWTYILPRSAVTMGFVMPEGAREVEIRNASGDTVSSYESDLFSRNEEIAEYKSRIDELFERLSAL